MGTFALGQQADAPMRVVIHATISASHLILQTGPPSHSRIAGAGHYVHAAGSVDGMADGHSGRHGAGKLCETGLAASDVSCAVAARQTRPDHRPGSGRA